MFLSTIRRNGPGRIRIPLAAAIWVILAINAIGPVCGEDVVIAKAKQGRGTVRGTGEIRDFTGKALTLRRAGDRDETIETARVVEIQTTWNAAHRAADELFAQKKYADALASYQAALGEESRIWVRRRILAQTIWCLRLTDRADQAIDVFLQLYRNDPTTQYFNSMPISWLGDAPTPALEKKAESLLAESSLAPGKLMAASWLIPTSRRATAINILQQLLTTEDSRVAYWAEAQLWRPQMVTATQDSISRWHRRWSRMPAELQPGPAFVLAQAYSKLKEPNEATLLYLRAPLLAPLDMGLASQALLAAGREFETMNRPDDAAQLYREIVTEYPKAVAVGLAEQRLGALKK